MTPASTRAPRRRPHARHPRDPLLLLSAAGDYHHTDESNLCGQISGAGSLSTDLSVTVSAVLDGHSDQAGCPERPSALEVRVPAWRLITEADPRYPVDGWRVRAWPDGALDTVVGRRDDPLYELPLTPERLPHEEGWCVEGALAQVTIEAAMADLGFLPSEISDCSDAGDADLPEADVMTVLPQRTGRSNRLI